MSGEMRPRDIALLELRLARLELSLLEVVTAVGMLVGELGLRGDLVLTTPKAVEEALEHGWQTLIGLPDQDAPGLIVDARFADRRRLAAAAPDALAGAVEATGAAVGALYTVEGNGLKLVASVGYPDGVMDEYSEFGAEADLPAAIAARTHRPLWFGTREQIVETYPHLREAHEQTEVALGQDAVEGAVVPIVADRDVVAVVIIGFTGGGTTTMASRLDAVRARFAASLRDR